MANEQIQRIWRAGRSLGNARAVAFIYSYPDLLCIDGQAYRRRARWRKR